jgi:aminoglycoside phosphotransferase (APT) family kinase protein
VSKFQATEIDARLAARLVASQFPQWAHLPIAPTDVAGWDNRTFRLGAELSIRMPSDSAYVAQVDKEHRWLPRLAPGLPFEVPRPIARGEPGDGYPFPWSVYGWIEGENAAVDRIDDLMAFAEDLAGFLRELQAIDATGGPPPGPHSFFRGGPLATYDQETRTALAAVRGRVAADIALAVWDEALAAPWRGAPDWVHGDVAASNLLVKRGRLTAVIDFGCLAVGDPACDTTIAWTLLTEPSRSAFRTSLGLDEDTWRRGRGWALWKALITLADAPDNSSAASAAEHVIDQVLEDHQLETR